MSTTYAARHTSAYERLALLLAVAFLLAGCGLSVRLGRVSDKWYAPAHCETTFTPVVDSYTGETRLDIGTKWVEASWSIRIDSLVDDRSQWAWVSEATYNAVRVGEYYRIGDRGSKPTLDAEETAPCR